MHITVIGAGISGISAAYYLAKTGYQVTVVNGDEDPAYTTSYENGGQISASNTETWHSWRHILKAISWIGTKDTPLFFNLLPSWQRYTWLAQFLTHLKDHSDHTKTICRSAIFSRQLYQQIIKEEGIQFDQVEKGIIHLYKTQMDLKYARKINCLYQQAGLERTELSIDEIFALEPQLNRQMKLAGGFYCPGDFTGDIYLFCKELSTILKGRYGVCFEHNTIEDLKYEMQQRPGPVIICAGVHSRQLAKSIGEKLPIYPVKGYSITIYDPGDAPWISLVDDTAKIVASRLGSSRLRIAGIAEFDGYQLTIRNNRINTLMDWVNKVYPGVNTKDFNQWCGLRPMTPSMMPIVRQSSVLKDVWYHTGHGQLGWTLSAFTAKEITRLIKCYYR